MATQYRIETDKFADGSTYYYPMYSRKAYWPFRLLDKRLHWNYFFNVYDNAIGFSKMDEAKLWLDSRMPNPIVDTYSIPYPDPTK